MDSKQNPMRKSNIPPIYWAILIGDSELSDKYSVTIPSVAVYGRIESSENVKKFLQLLAKLRVYGNIDR